MNWRQQWLYGCLKESNSNFKGNSSKRPVNNELYFQLDPIQHQRNPQVMQLAYILQNEPRLMKSATTYGNWGIYTWQWWHTSSSIQQFQVFKLQYYCQLQVLIPTWYTSFRGCCITGMILIDPYYYPRGRLAFLCPEHSHFHHIHFILIIPFIALTPKANGN